MIIFFYRIYLLQENVYLTPLTKNNTAVYTSISNFSLSHDMSAKFSMGGAGPIKSIKEWKMDDNRRQNIDVIIPLVS